MTSCTLYRCPFGKKGNCKTIGVRLGRINFPFKMRGLMDFWDYVHNTEAEIFYWDLNTFIERKLNTAERDKTRNIDVSLNP